MVQFLWNCCIKFFSNNQVNNDECKSIKNKKYTNYQSNNKSITIQPNNVAIFEGYSNSRITKKPLKLEINSIRTKLSKSTTEQFILYNKQEPYRTDWQNVTIKEEPSEINHELLYFLL